MRLVSLGLTFGDLIEVLLACRQLGPTFPDPADFQMALSQRLADTSRDLAVRVMRLDRPRIAALAEFAEAAHSLTVETSPAAHPDSSADLDPSRQTVPDGPALGDETPRPERRRCRRRAARGLIRVFCHRGTLDLGANLATRVLDVSESGVRLLVRAPLEKGEEVLVGLEGPGHHRPVKLRGKVAWCRVVDGGTFQSGIQFHHHLEYHDLFKLT